MVGLDKNIIMWTGTTTINTASTTINIPVTHDNSFLSLIFFMFVFGCVVGIILTGIIGLIKLTK